MKSDCTHRLNKREATKDDIVLSLSLVMATKVADFLKRARVEKGRAILAGGTTRNPHILRYLRELLPEVEFVVPPEAPYFEAWGAALLARASGSPFPEPSTLLREGTVGFGSLEPLSKAERLVTYFEGKTGPVVAGQAPPGALERAVDAIDLRGGRKACWPETCWPASI